jgi:hypothetical protein
VGKSKIKKYREQIKNVTGGKDEAKKYSEPLDRPIAALNVAEYVTGDRMV